MVDSWTLVKKKLKENGFSDYQISQIYSCITEVACDKGVRFLKL